MPVWWTKRSLPPSSGVMKPKPLSSLNHFTVPVAMIFLHGLCALRTRRKLLRQRLRALNTADVERGAPDLNTPVYRKNLRPPTNTARAGPGSAGGLENNVCRWLSRHVVGRSREAEAYRRVPPSSLDH